eukprot:3898504-Amphidinium_carterae.1
MAKHFEEAHQDVKLHSISPQMDQQSETQLTEDKDRAEACTPSFLERINVAEPDDFERHGLNGRIILTRPLRCLSGTSGCRSSDTSTARRMGSTSSAVPVFDVPGDTRSKAHGTRSASFAVQGGGAADA